MKVIPEFQNNAPTGDLKISGSVMQGQKLKVLSTLADVDGIGQLQYQWLRNGTAINSAIGSNYKLVQADVGKAISIKVTYTDALGTIESRTSATTVPVSNVNDGPKGGVTINGLLLQGQKLTAKHALTDADGLGQVKYQWLRDGEAIDGATAKGYTLAQADVGKSISVKAFYTDGFGKNESVFSAATLPITNINDLPTGAVAIAGTPKQGIQLRASHALADSDGMGTVTYQWLRNGSMITGATGDRYTLAQADVGNFISVRASYTDALGTKEQFVSKGTIPVANVNDLPTGNVVITGLAMQGQELTASHTLVDIDGLGEVEYQWLRDGKAISGATATRYTLTAADVGKTIIITASYIDGFHTKEKVFSAATAVVASENHKPTGTVVINGAAMEGEQLTASHTLNDMDGMGVATYQWLRNGEVIEGATHEYYTLTQSDAGNVISVKAAYIDGLENTEFVTSAATALVAFAPDNISGDADGIPTADLIRGGNGVSTLDGKDGNDTLYGGEGNDLIFGGFDNDKLYGDNGDDSLSGSIGNDALDGGNGNDTLDGGPGNDWLGGGSGNDLLDGGTGSDTMDGDDGFNTVSYANSYSEIHAFLYKEVEQVENGRDKDTLYGIQSIIGSRVNDIIAGNIYNNTIEGGPGDDFLDGDKGVDTLSYASAPSAVKVVLSWSGGQVSGGAGNDYISSFENILGSKYDDHLAGNDSANTLTGGGGNDTLSGGLGNDVLSGGEGKDVFVFNTMPNTNSNVDTILDFTSAVDRIQLSSPGPDIPTGIGGKILSSAFVLGAKATSTANRLVYDEDNGYLYADADGTGISTAVLIAKLGAGTKLTIDDLFVY